MVIGQSYGAARKSNRSNRIGSTSMSSFAPQPVLTPHHFEIVENGRGYWLAKDEEGLIGGVFRSQKDALRFALFEVRAKGGGSGPPAELLSHQLLIIPFLRVLYGAGTRSCSKTYWLIALYWVHTAPGEELGS